MNARYLPRTFSIFLLIQVLSVGSVFIIMETASRNDLRTELRRQQETYRFQTSRFAEQVNSLMSQAFQLVDFLSAISEGTASPADPRRLFDRLRRGSTELMQGVKNALFMDAGGRIHVLGDSDPTLSAALEGGQLLGLHRELLRQTVSGNVSAERDETAWYISKRIDAKDGSFSGAFILVFADDIFPSMQDENQLSMSECVIYDTEGAVLYRKTFGENALDDYGRRNLRSHPLFMAHADDLIGRGGTGIFVDSNSVTTSSKLRDFSYGIAVSYDLSRFLGEWNSRRTRTETIGIGLSSVFGLFVFLAIHQVRRRMAVQKEKQKAEQESSIYRLLQEMQQDAKNASGPRELLRSCLLRILGFLEWDSCCFLVPPDRRLGLASEYRGCLPEEAGIPEMPAEILGGFLSAWNKGQGPNDPLRTNHAEPGRLGMETVLPFGIGEAGEAAGIAVFRSKRPREVPEGFSVPLRRISAFLMRLLVEKKADDDMRASLAEKEILLKEVHHRIKNNLQIITSLLALQGLDCTDSKAVSALEKAQNRVRSIALVHEEIYKTSSLSSVELRGYIESLAASLLKILSLENETVALEVDIPPGIEIKLSKAVPCGLILNELITNSLKYAFPDGRKGRIFVGTEKAEDGGIILTYRDDGIGLGGAGHREGSLGLKLVEAMTIQLGGEMKTESSNGLAYTFRFPLDR